MCGIFGYVGDAQNAADLVLRGLKKLEYRGYDSWGVAVGHRDQVVLAKRTGKIGDADGLASGFSTLSSLTTSRTPLARRATRSASNLSSGVGTLP